MRLIYAGTVAIFVITVLTILSCSTRDKSKYWHTPHTSLYNIVYDASTNLERAKHGNGDRNRRMRDISNARAYLRSARNMATDRAIADILKVDAVKLQNDIDLTRAKISGKSRGRRKSRMHRKRSPPPRQFRENTGFSRY